MTPTVDVEITSKTTARATLADANVPPMNLEAHESKTLSTVVHEFLHNMAQAQGVDVEVIYRTAKDTRFLTVGPDGKAEERAPSMPPPIITEAPPEPVLEPVSTPRGGPVVVAAEQMAYEPAPQPVDASTPSRVGQRPTGPATGPIKGPLDVRPQLSAPHATPDDSPDVVSPARKGLRGTLNTLGFKLPPKSGSSEERARRTAAVTSRYIATISRQVHADATIAVLNPKGGVGKTPLLLGIADTLAMYRPATSIVAFDVSDSGGGLADRAAVGADHGPDLWDVLEHAEELTAPGVRASALGRFTIRQPTGVEIVPGYRRIAAAAIDRHACETLASVLRRHRQMLLVDTGNNTNSSAWQWATEADVVVIPVPLRGTIPGTVAEMIDDLAGVAPEVLDRVLMLITEGPDDDPETEFDDVETFIRGGIAPDRFVRIPYDRLLHSGRINYPQLQPKTRTALIAAAAKVVELLSTIDPTTGGLIDTTELHSIARPQPITRIRS
ncbi:MinD/ParA family ATP-binding protein [Rhodococcus opacus]|uniref:AAA domain-containing protein n=1 Tax=Rhodococcus opacus TaxID=37919 RepID=A0A2S8J2B1_RHOOP|nr:hypothetical protein [Rhodococcus opacus]PQP21168.1 hypothetical protein C5613_26805 [Rhodococcus opacus]